MNNLRSLIKSFFHENCPVSQLHSLNNFFSNSNFKEELFSVRKTRYSDDLINYSDDELKNLDLKFNQDWQYLPDSDKTKKGSKYNLLIHFTNQVLIEETNEPFVVYHHLFRWKDLSLHIGEDILTTSYLAYNDIKSCKERVFFSWRPHLFTNNKRLKSILKQGIAENHSHLNATGLNFDFSWIALMNHFDNLKPTLLRFSKTERNHINAKYLFKNINIEFCNLIEYAVNIRLLLYYCIDFFKHETNIELRDYLSSKTNCNLNSSNGFIYFEDEIKRRIVSKKLKDEISYLREFESYKVKRSNDNYECFDYFIPKSISDKNKDNLVFLYGERKLMYDCFKIIYENKILSNENDFIIFEKLFYSYLLIKNDFRKEIIQLNGRYGFGNFKSYQDKKFEFLIDRNIKTRIYSDAYFSVVFNLYPRLMNMNSYELRIGPPKSEENFVKLISYYDSIIEKNKKLKSTFVVHFFKKTDSINLDGVNSEIKERHHQLRIDIREEALVIVGIRENAPKIAKRIVGIDAASSEFSCRPEVFGQVFRFLKNHHLREEHHAFKKYKSNKLKLTFHAGEDFFDIIDGLRYIDESIKFLGMSDGDRLGHALALGIDSEYFYKLKNKTILLSKQLLLDNVVWVINKSKKFGIYEKHISVMQNLESLYYSLASELYINPINEKYASEVIKDNLNVYNQISYTHQLFYDAWKLRGDNPNNYYKYFNNNQELNSSDISYWDRCGLNHSNPKLNQLRSRKDVCFLYYEYHYNTIIKEKGNEIKEFVVSEKYIKLVTDIQYSMLAYVASRNIGIETNPSSNYLIGTIDRYIQHPIFKFNAKGLNFNNDYISPLVSVSVNTDDAGIFHTSLENEYALLAIALEKEKDEDGNPIFKTNDIYDWIDHIRKMGLHQSF